MIAMFQIMTGGINIHPDQFFAPAERSTTRGHPMKLRKPQATARARRHALAVRAINDWNALPSSIVLAPSLNRFKHLLDKHWDEIAFTIPVQDH